MKLLSEYENYIRFKNLERDFLNFSDNHKKLLPVYERFVISLYNDCDKKSINIRISAFFVKKTLSEILTLFPKFNTLLFDEMINNFNTFHFLEEEGSNKIILSESQISFLDFSIVRSERVDLIISLAGENTGMKILLRNSTIPHHSQTWSLTQDFANSIFEENITNEAFSSPFNSYFLGKGRWCSLFPDIEGKIGSLGNFFDVDFSSISGGWVVNPPFIEEIMMKCVEKILNHFISGNAKNSFIIFLPDWRDTSSITSLLSFSKEGRVFFYERRIMKKTFPIYDSTKGIVVYPNFNAVFYLISPSDREKEFYSLRKIIKNY